MDRIALKIRKLQSANIVLIYIQKIDFTLANL